MRSYEGKEPIVGLSLEELGHIARFISERENPSRPTTVLIGGWAVFAYNPWYASIDIDLVTNSDTRSRLQNFLVSERGFKWSRRINDTKCVRKPTEFGSVVIDFASREQPDPFEGREDRVEFGILDGRTVVRRMDDDVIIPVPERTALLALKLKASWDRSYRIRKGTAGDLAWERGRLLKDRGDILALLDPKEGGREIDIQFLGQFLEEHGFLRNCLEEVGGREVAESYRRMTYEVARDLVQDLMSLL